MTMSHPVPTGNGASLEDCHTNLFALTDLSGIKWRKLSAGPVFCIDTLDDPVLLSFSRCIQSDILSVWRRVPKVTPPEQQQTNVPPLRANDHLNFTKELWIYWYGDAPANLDNLLHPQLKEVEFGSWDGGLSYECRVLLFKALHNLIERCLVSRNFVRLGKWFVQPHEHGSQNADRSPHLSFAFSFFLHGESTVCASVDVRQHSPVWKVVPQDLTVALGTQGGRPVVLAPYGLSGTITGHSYKDTEQTTKKLQEEWQQFYPIKMEDNSADDKMPAMVEVLVAGVRMRYPSCFVLLAETDDVTPIKTQPVPIPPSMSSTPHPGSIPVPPSTTPLTPPTSPCDANVTGETSIKVMATSTYADSTAEQKRLKMQSNNAHSLRIVEKVWQEGCMPMHSKRSAAADDDASAVGSWDFIEPTQRQNCGCTKLKNKQRSGNQQKGLTGPGSKHQKGEKGDKEKDKMRYARNMTPFHRRSPLSEDMLMHDYDNIIVQRGMNEMPFSNFKTQGSTPQMGQFNRTTSYDNNSGGSPHSGAPSPLVASHSQPSDGHSASDPTMPTLSPHPPSKHDKEHGVVGDPRNAAQPANTMNNNTSGDYYNSKLQGVTHKTEPFTSTYQTTVMDCRTDSMNWLDVQRHHLEEKGMKRPPKLPFRSHELGPTDNIGSDGLYDFDVLHAWLDHPVKKFKAEPPPAIKPEARPVPYSNSNSQQQYNHPQPSPKMAATNISPSPVEKFDPYEFSDEASSNAGNFSRPRSFRGSRGEEFSRPSLQDDENPYRGSTGGKDDRQGNNDLSSPSTPGGTGMSATSLFRETDIKPSMKDLDNIFDTDEDDNDDAFHPPSHTEDFITKPNKANFGHCGASTMGPTELSRMFPTPPSIENNTALSPCTPLPPETCIAEVRPEPVLRSPKRHKIIEEKDRSLVYKPPPTAKFVGSGKYSPIELPSSKMSPVHSPQDLSYKPSWQFVPVMDKHQQTPSQYLMPSSLENTPVAAPKSVPEKMNTIDASPAGYTGTSPAAYPGHSPAAYPGTPAAYPGTSPAFQGSMQQRTPASYELQSPASNASSYMNKNLSSVDNHGTNLQIPEVHSLVTNVALSDSVLNIFKDHNYDSCNICVCNMNIKGGDMGIYLTDFSAEPQFKCTCGFSAVVNRKYSQYSGLFYEDEIDITGLPHDRYDRRKSSLLAVEQSKPENTDEGGGSNGRPTGPPSHEDIPQTLLLLLQEMFSTPFPSYTVLQRNKQYESSVTLPQIEPNRIEIQDGCEACYGALEMGRQAADNNCSSQKLDEQVMKTNCLHKWSYTHNGAIIPTNSQDVVRLLKSLQPMLQDAIQKKRTTRLWEQVYNISGPLSWKDFHLLAGRGSDEACEPQPIPSLLFGYDKDWLSQAPMSLRGWDKLLLEPYSKPRDVVYVVVAPDNDYLLTHIRQFFKELSTVYELCRLGKHIALDKTLRDGIMRVGKTMAKKLADAQVEEWFKNIGDSNLAAKLRLYALVCTNYLGPLLANQNMDRASLFGTPSSKNVVKPPSHSAPSPAPPHTPDGHGAATPQSDDRDPGSEASGHHRDATDDSEDASDAPSLVVYFVDPFSYGQEWDDLNRLAMLGILRCYSELWKGLPESMQNNVHLQIVPLQSILDRSGDRNHLQHLKTMAFSIFTQCRSLLTHSISGRHLTGFGPAAGAEAVLKGKNHDRLERLPVTRFYGPPYILTPQKDKQTQLAESCGEVRDKSGIMLCGYCPSEDQRWLLAVVTDDRGELLETCMINIEIPNRNRRKKASARKIGLQKLWDFLLGVMSATTTPWRLIVGRFGRLGHGELKGWSGLLSRKSLLRASKQLHDMCPSCAIPNSDSPCILSACLVSMEPQSTFHIMTDSVKNEEKRASNAPLNTPQDASVTHILVFPTSAMAQANTTAIQHDSTISWDGMDLPGTLFGNLEEDLNIEQDLNDFLGLGNSPITSPVGSPKADGTAGMGSPGLGASGRHSPSSQYHPGGKTMRGASISLDLQEEAPNLLQQPLAMGYYLSTAKTGPLPKWFYSSCLQKENVCPATFKSALHVHCSHIQQNQEADIFHANQNKMSHPLDSSLTCDVLRFVLETYNALSWLTMDPATNNRRSCLPIHFVILMQLYHSMKAYV